jgi:ABC-type lipopolysaccharide export system ATPase subunit
MLKLPVNTEEIKGIIRLQSKHKGFIITDHDYKNVTAIATKTILIHDGGVFITNQVKSSLPNKSNEWYSMIMLVNFSAPCGVFYL